MFNNI